MENCWNGSLELEGLMTSCNSYASLVEPTCGLEAHEILFCTKFLILVLVVKDDLVQPTEEFQLMLCSEHSRHCLTQYNEHTCL